MHDNQPGVQQITRSWLDGLMAPLVAEQAMQQLEHWKTMGALASPSSREAVNRCIEASRANRDAARKKVRALNRPAVA